MQPAPETMFGNADALDLRQRELEAARNKQPFKYAVPPGRTLDVVRGGKEVRLQAGAEVTMADVTRPGRPGHELMRSLVNRGLVLEATDAQIRAANTSPDAEFVVSARGALVTRRESNGKGHGVLIPGEEIKPEDLEGGRKQLLELVAKGRVTHRKAKG